MSKVVVNGYELEVEVEVGESATAAEIAKAINEQVPGARAWATDDGGISLSSSTITIQNVRRTIPRHIAAAAKRAGLPAEVGGARGEVPLWLGEVLQELGRFGAHPGRYRARLRHIAAHQDVLCAAWRLGGEAAVHEAYAELRRLDVG